MRAVRASVSWPARPAGLRKRSEAESSASVELGGRGDDGVVRGCAGLCLLACAPGRLRKRSEAESSASMELGGSGWL